MSTAQNIPIKTKDQIRDDMSATYREQLISLGVANPVVTPGTDIYNRFEAIAQQIWVAAASIPAAVDESLEDTALLNLERLAAMRELSLRAAGGSRGDVFPALAIAGPVLIPAGSTLIDGQGLRYRATLGGPIENGDPLTVEALDTGAATNRPPDTTLTFEAPPLYVEPKAPVGPGGLRFGVDTEDLEGLRERLSERMAHPRNGVNWPTFTAAAETSTAVQKAFAYQACNGPSTVHVAVVGSPSAEVKDRDVDAITMTVEVIPTTAGATFSFVEVVTTTVINEPVDVSMALAIPASPAANPPGNGGGWIDAVPFPVLASPGYVAVSSFFSSVEIEVSSDVPPAVGAQVSWISRDDWKLRTAEIVTIVGTNPYVITLSLPFVSDNGVDIQIGDWVFPASENGAAYAESIFAAFAKLGPGEKTSVAGLLPRALRKPSPAESWPYEMKAPFLKLFTGELEEVSDSAFLYRSAITPTIPGVITDPPRCFVPRQIGFYPLE